MNRIALIKRSRFAKIYPIVTAILALARLRSMEACPEKNQRSPTLYDCFYQLNELALYFLVVGIPLPKLVQSNMVGIKASGFRVGSVHCSRLLFDDL